MDNTETMMQVTLQDMDRLAQEINAADGSLSEQEWHQFRKEYEQWLDQCWAQDTAYEAVDF